MHKRLFPLVALCLCTAAPLHAQDRYYPETTWAERTPADAGMDAAQLDAAVAFAIEQETQQPRDLDLTIALSFA
ncbi:MAG: serine hydrolase, partial [Bacteroidota bacterium]